MPPLYIQKLHPNTHLLAHPKVHLQVLILRLLSSPTSSTSLSWSTSIWANNLGSLPDFNTVEMFRYRDGRELPMGDTKTDEPVAHAFSLDLVDRIF